MFSFFAICFWLQCAKVTQVLEISLMRKNPPSKVNQKVMIKYTITQCNVVKEILKKLDMTMFGVKYLKKWTPFFCEIGFVFFLLSYRLISSQFVHTFNGNLLFAKKDPCLIDNSFRQDLL